MVHNHWPSLYELHFLYYSLVCTVGENISLLRQLLLGEVDTHCQPEVVGEMHHFPEIGGWLEVEHKMGKNSGHKESNLEGSGRCEHQLVDERREPVAELQLLSLA